MNVTLLCAGTGGCKRDYGCTYKALRRIVASARAASREMSERIRTASTSPNRWNSGRREYVASIYIGHTHTQAALRIHEKPLGAVSAGEHTFSKT